MIRKRDRFLSAALIAAAAVVLTAGPLRATSVTSTILLGPSNGAGNIGTFSGTVSLGSGSQIAFGSNAVSGNYQQGALFTHINFPFSTQNTTSTLSLAGGSVSLNTSNSSGTANLTYDNVSPGSPQSLNSFSANLSDGAVAPMTINASSIPLSVDGINFTLTPTFTGSLSGISFTSSGSADASLGDADVPGTFSVVLNGSVTGNLSLVGNIGTLYTLPSNTVVTFAGSLPIADLNLSDTGVPYGAFPDSTHKNNLLADFAANLSSLPAIPFQFVAPLATSANFSVGNTSSGVTSIKIQNTTLTANLMLSNLAFNLSGQTPNVLIPEPSSLVLGSLALVGLVGMAYRRKQGG
jgi:hypothetical protein